MSQTTRTPASDTIAHIRNVLALRPKGYIAVSIDVEILEQALALLDGARTP